MEAGRDGSGRPGPSVANADVTRPVELSSADVDISRLKTRVPFDVDEIDLLLGTVPFHLLRCSELEQQLGKEAFESWYDEAAKNKEKYLATYPDFYSTSGSHQEVPQSSDTKASVDYESLEFDSVCDSIPEIIRAYNEAHLEDDEIGTDVTKEAVEHSRAEYKRLNELLKNLGTSSPGLTDVDLWTDSSKEPQHPKKLEHWTRSETEWAEFSREVQREVDIVKTLCKNEQYNPVVRKPLSWLDQFVGAVEKETGIPFDAEFAEHMADLAAGKDSDISLHAHARSMDAHNLAESDDSDDEPVTGLREKTAPNENFAGTKPPVNKAPDRPMKIDNLEEPPSVEEPFNLEKELERYVGLKTRFLLSRVHDDGKIKWKKNNDKASKSRRRAPNVDLDEWYFGPKEFIILRDEGDKKTRTDIIVDRDEDLCEKIAVIEGAPAKKRLRSTSSTDPDKNYFLERLLTPRFLKEQGIETGGPDKSQPHQECHHTETSGSPDQVVPCEVLESKEEDREKRLQRRKMFRWERFQFRDVPESAEAESELTEDSKFDAGSQPEVPEVPQTKDPPQTRAGRRRQIADSLFQDDSKKYVEYVDPSEMTGWELHRPVPIITAASLSLGYIPEVVSPQPKPPPMIFKPQKSLPRQRTDSSEASTIGKPAIPSEGTVPSVTPAYVGTSELTPAQGPTVVNPAPTTTDTPVPKKDKSSSKKDKKKKKRRSSSSSDDLEMLEKKSEARLGLRK